MPQGCCKTCYNTILSFCMFTVNVESQQNKFKNRFPVESLQQDNKNTSGTSNTSKNSSSSSSKRSRNDSFKDDSDGKTNGERTDDPETRLRSTRKKNSEKLHQAINEIRYTDSKRDKSEMVRDKLYLLMTNKLFSIKLDTL